MPEKKRKPESRIIKVFIMLLFLVMSIPTYILVQYVLFGMSLKDVGATPDKISLEINPVFILFIIVYWFAMYSAHKWAKGKFKNTAEWDDW